MEGLPERLRSLTHSKVFAIIAVVFFAFLVAVFFVILGQGNANTQTNIEKLRADIPQNESSGSSGSNSQQNSQTSNPTKDNSDSFVDKIIRTITGGSNPEDSESNSTLPSKQKNPDNEKNESPDSPSSGSKIPKRGTEEERKTIESPKRTSSEVRIAPPIPQTQIDSFTLSTSLPAAPANLKLYTVKTSFSDADVQSFAQTLGINNQIILEKGTSLMQVYDEKSLSYLGFNTTTGDFVFNSEKGFTPSNISTSYESTAQSFITDIGLNNDCISSYATYKRYSNPGVVYVEFHCNPETFGAPIYNPISLMSMDEAVDMKEVGPSVSFSPVLLDEDVYETSDKTDGFSRLSDFNTATIGLSETDRKVLEAASNLPLLVSEEIIDSQSILSREEAFALYKENQTSLGLTSPTGTGNINLADMYPDNIAHAASVNVTDATIAYITNFNNPVKYWCPSYVFRSFGDVDTGYESHFVHVVSAVNDPRCQQKVLGKYDPSTPFAQNLLAQAQNTPEPSPITHLINDSYNSSLQYGSFTQAETVPPASECPAYVTHAYSIADKEWILWQDSLVNADFDKQFNIENGAEILPRYQKELKQKFPRKWWFAWEDGASVTSVDEKKLDQVRKVRDRLAGNCFIGRLSSCNDKPNILSKSELYCVFITQGSPWIYASSPSSEKVTISLKSPGGIMYAQPSLTSKQSNSWTVTTGRKNMLTLDSGLSANGLYWEYNQDQIEPLYTQYLQDHPTRSVILRKAEVLPYLEEYLYTPLQLTDVQRNNWNNEIARDLPKVTEDFVKIHLVPEEFIHSAIPMLVSPTPKSINRYYIALEGTQDKPTKNRTLDMSVRMQPSKDGLAIQEFGTIFLHLHQ